MMNKSDCEWWKLAVVLTRSLYKPEVFDGATWTHMLCWSADSSTYIQIFLIWPVREEYDTSVE